MCLSLTVLGGSLLQIRVISLMQFSVKMPQKSRAVSCFLQSSQSNFLKHALGCPLLGDVPSLEMSLQLPLH